MGIQNHCPPIIQARDREPHCCRTYDDYLYSAQDYIQDRGWFKGQIGLGGILGKKSSRKKQPSNGRKEESARSVLLMLKGSTAW